MLHREGDGENLDKGIIGVRSLANWITGTDNSTSKENAVAPCLESDMSRNFGWVPT
jgi:hypothetical protein